MKVIRVKTSEDLKLKALLLGYNLARYSSVDGMADRAIAKAKEQGSLQIVAIGMDTSIVVEDDHETRN